MSSWPSPHAMTSPPPCRPYHHLVNCHHITTTHVDCHVTTVKCHLPRHVIHDDAAMSSLMPPCQHLRHHHSHRPLNICHDTCSQQPEGWGEQEGSKKGEVCRGGHSTTGGMCPMTMMRGRGYALPQHFDDRGGVKPTRCPHSFHLPSPMTRGYSLPWR
jgi:hypothetical protein